MSGYYNSTVLDGPSVYGSITVGTTPVELKVGASPFEERKAVTLISLNRNVYLGYDASVTTSTGTLVFKNQLLLLEASSSMSIYLVATNNTDVRIAELS